MTKSNTAIPNPRFRLSTTESTAIALHALLARTPELNSELLELRGKLDIFIARLQMGARIPSYIPKGSHVVSEDGTVTKSSYSALMNSSETSGEIRNKLFAFTIQNGREPTNDECAELVATVHSNNMNEDSI